MLVLSSPIFGLLIASTAKTVQGQLRTPVLAAEPPSPHICLPLANRLYQAADVQVRL